MVNGFDCVGMMYGIPGGGALLGMVTVLIQLGILVLITLGSLYLWKQIQKKR